MRYDRCLDVVLEHEGGFVDHPDDPGGATNYGITKEIYEIFLQRPVTVQEIKDMPLSHARIIYERIFWNKLNCHWFPVGVDLVVFDMGVNAGVRRAIRILQQEVGGLVVDGIPGSKTRAGVIDYCKEHGAKDLIDLYTIGRICYYRTLDHYDVFGKGWTRRSRHVKEKAMEMVDQYG